MLKRVTKMTIDSAIEELKKAALFEKDCLGRTGGWKPKPFFNNDYQENAGMRWTGMQYDSK